MSMSVRAIDRRRHAQPAALALLLAAGLGGCVTQDYVRGLGHHAAKGAMDGVADGIAAIEEPLRQTLRRTLVEDGTLRQAAKDMTETAVKSLEAGLASAEMRKQIDDLVTQAVASARRNGDEAIRRLIQTAEPELSDAMRRLLQTAEPELKEALRRAATEGLESASAKLRDRIERDLTPATERLARRTGEQLIASLVAGLEGPLNKRLMEAGQDMSKSLIKGVALGFNEPGNQESFGTLTQVMSLQAVRGARQGMKEGLPDERQVTLVASIVVLAALLLLAAASLSLLWWRYHQSAKSLTIMAENINLHESEELKAAIQQSAHDNYVGPWLSSFLKRRGL
jgi:vacuolar-type H+-ATPase subunit E/Vma4